MREVKLKERIADVIFVVALVLMVAVISPGPAIAALAGVLLGSTGLAWAAVVLGLSGSLWALFNQEGEKPWHLWLPALAQITLMGRVLKGEAIGTVVGFVLPFSLHPLLLPCALILVSFFAGRAIGSFHFAA